VQMHNELTESSTNDVMPIRPVQRAIFFIGLALLFVFSLARFADNLNRSVYPLNDLTPGWVSSQAFINGKNPYNDTQELEKIWASTRIYRAGGCADYKCILNKFPMAYLPTALPLFALLALLPWHTAVYAYLVASTLSIVAMVVLLAQRLKYPWTDPRKWYMIAFPLAMAPLQTSVHCSNVNTIIIALLGAGVILMRERPYFSGFTFAISICLKPQLAFLFFAYPWLRKKWKTVFAELAVCGIICVCVMLWAGFHHLELLKAYSESLAEFNTPGGQNSFFENSPKRYLLVNVQVIAYQFTHSPMISEIISWTFFLLLAAVSLFLIHTRVSDRNEGIGIAIISVLTLLPVYQRIYSAAILIFVVYWAIENWFLRAAKAALLIMFPMLLPLATLSWSIPRMANFVEIYHLDTYFLWNAFIMPHQVWIELCLLLILLYVLSRSQRAVSDPSPRVSTLAPFF